MRCTCFSGLINKRRAIDAALFYFCLMGHDHHDHTAVGNIKLAFFINLLFTIIEIIGGFFTSSTAILADAVHDLGDSLALGMAWYLEKKSDKHDMDVSVSFVYDG